MKVWELHRLEKAFGSTVTYLIFVLITIIVSALKQCWKLSLKVCLWDCVTGKEAGDHTCPIPESADHTALHSKLCRWIGLQWGAEWLPSFSFKTRDTACKWEGWVLTFGAKLFLNLHSDPKTLSNFSGPYYIVETHRQIASLVI